jgi:hypothetical protein
MSTSSELVVIPQTGEAIDVKSASTDALTAAHDDLASFSADVRSHQRTVDDELIARMDHEGLRTYHGEGYTLEATKPTEREWDIELLADTLDRLVRDGIISQRKADACVVQTPKPVARELRTLEADPRCQHQIAACFTEAPANRYLRVKR